MFQMILTDLDDTLLRSDKTISPYTVDVLRRCRAAGAVIGFSTARGEARIRPYIDLIQPDVIISSGGAMVRLNGEIIHSVMFSAEESCALVGEGLRRGCLVTADVPGGNYRNYYADSADAVMGNASYTDFSGFAEPALKICIDLSEPAVAAEIAQSVPGCDWLRFTGGDWYKFTRAGATKEGAIAALCGHLDISPAEIAAFGDDLGDIGMLKMCGVGVAVANAVAEVRAVADELTNSNDDDGVARWLEAQFNNL